MKLTSHLKKTNRIRSRLFSYIRNHTSQILCFIQCHPSGRFLFLMVLTFVFLLIADSAFARLGGGGGYRGGGGGGRGGSFGGGRGSGDGEVIFWVIMLVIHYPHIGIPVLIVIGIIFYFGGKQGHSAHVTRTIRKGYVKQKNFHFDKAEKAILARDPSFSKKALADRIVNAFNQLQNAWANQDMKPVRHLVSDGIFERFSLQLEIQKASYIRNVMEDVSVSNAKVVAIESDRFFDTVHIEINAASIDYFVNTTNDKFIYGSRRKEPFTEYWSFLRRPGAQTLTKPGLIEGFCPNCGTPIEIGEKSECPSCKAFINSGEYDWVLTEITQASEWNFHPRKSIYGLDKLLEKDPSFNVQHIEDRTSVMFIRYIAAQFFADSKYLSKLASDDFILNSKKHFTPLENGKHSFFADASVGTVEMVEAETDDDTNEFDRIRVKVKWSGHRVEKEVPSYIRPDFNSSLLYTNEYILIRKKSVVSSDKNILTSSHCPACGAPETSSTTGHCEYCNVPLNDGSRDWNLGEINKFSGYRRQEAETPYQDMTHNHPQISDTGPVLTSFDNENVVACVIAIMLADGEIDGREKQLLQQMAEGKGISNERLDVIIKSVQTNGLEIPSPDTPAKAKEFLRCMIRMCLADGKVTNTEMDMLKKLVSRMGYTDLDIKQMISKERSALYKESKKVIKGIQ